MHKHTLQMGHVRAVYGRSCSLCHARMHGRQKTWLHSGRILQGTHHFLVAEPSIIHAPKTWITNPKRRPTKLGISRQIAQWCLTVSASGGTAAAADAVVAGADRNSNAPELKTIIATTTKKRTVTRHRKNWFHKTEAKVEYNIRWIPTRKPMR